MDIIELEEYFSHTLSKKRVTELAVIFGNDPTIPLDALYRTAFHPDGSIAFRAAWVLETIAERYPDRFSSIAALFLSEIGKQDNRSCQRHFSKTLLFITDKKAPPPYRQALMKTDREAIVENIFDWVIDPKTPIAVIANCLDVLFYFTGEFDWIGEELQQQIQLRSNQGSPALDSRGKRILKKLAKY